MELQERKRLILARQFLTRPGEKIEVCGALCGIQAQYTHNAFHALRIRTRKALESDAWGNELYKAWTLRGTMHVYPQEEQSLFMHQDNASAWSMQLYQDDTQVAGERKRFYEALILKRLTEGCATRDELKQICRQNGMTQEEQEIVFHPWGGVIRTMAERGEIAYRVDEGKTFVRCKPFIPMDKAQAELELLRRYLAHYGPATLRDIAYFFGWTQAYSRTLLSQIEDVRAEKCEGETVYDRGAREPGPISECILLAGFDPLLLGYEKTHSPFLPPQYIRGIFNTTGIVFPAILYKGRVVGKWKERKGRIAFEPFEALNSAAKKRIENTAGKCFGESLRSIAWG